MNYYYLIELLELVELLELLELFGLIELLELLLPNYILYFNFVVTCYSELPVLGLALLYKGNFSNQSIVKTATIQSLPLR